MTNETRMKWFKFTVLVLGGGTIYKLANLKDAFYVPMQEYMGLSHTQIGNLLSINSLFATALFVVGGYLADRFAVHRVIPIGLVGAGLTGIFLSTFPGYNSLLIIFALLAICSDCFFWPALLKAIRNLGGRDEQGRMFGFLEGGRGVVDTLVAFSALGLFVALGSGSGGLKAAILLYACIDIVVGVATFFLLQGIQQQEPEQDEGDELKGLAAIKQAIKLPALWLVSLNVFIVYTVYCGLTYFIPFLKDIYGMPVAFVGAYGIINQYCLKIAGGPLGGYLADTRFKSASLYTQWAFLALIPVMLLILWLPASSGLMIVAMAMTLSFALIVFTMRGIFWAPMEEVGIPREITGSAFGIACLVGYSPGMFAFSVYGSILDANPGAAGYYQVFSLMIAISLVGFLVAHLLHRTARNSATKKRAVETV